jgi:hypothetical protein
MVAELETVSSPSAVIAEIVRRWASERADDVRACYLVPDCCHLDVMIVAATVGWNAALRNEAHSLERDLRSAGIDSEVTVLPLGTRSSLYWNFNSGAELVYGEAV